MQFDRARFWDLYGASFGRKPMNAKLTAIREECFYLLTEFEKQTTITDLRQIAYCFATIKHETADTFAPVEEGCYLKTQARIKAFQKTLRYYPYFGRGYVQLTWKKNYIKAGKFLGLDFVANPDLLLERENSFQILIHGMNEGWFTSKKLSDYITNKSVDYINARRIINGTDKASAIAQLAIKFEGILKTSAAANQQTTATPPPDPTDKPVTDNQTPTPPILINKEKISTFTKLITGAKTLIGGTISAIGVWIGADDVKAILTKKADLLDMESFILIFGVMFKLAIVVGAGVFVVWLASSGYDKARAAVLAINTTKLENAANPDTNTVDFKK